MNKIFKSLMQIASLNSSWYLMIINTIKIKQLKTKYFSVSRVFFTRNVYKNNFYTEK